MGDLRDEAHVWTLVPDGMNDRFENWLSPVERKRWQRFVRSADRDLFLAAHGFCRQVLSEYADLAPTAWEFEIGEHGKPRIANNVALEFNLSHTSGPVGTRGLVGVVVTGDTTCGIDVESLDSADNIELLTKTSMAAYERIDIGQHADPRKRFYQHWTLKESYLKARGAGLSFPLDRFGFVLDPLPSLTVEPPIIDDVSLWQFLTVDTSDTTILSVALKYREQALNIILV